MSTQISSVLKSQAQIVRTSQNLASNNYSVANNDNGNASSLQSPVYVEG